MFLLILRHGFKLQRVKEWNKSGDILVEVNFGAKPFEIWDDSSYLFIGWGEKRDLHEYLYILIINFHAPLLILILVYIINHLR